MKRFYVLKRLFHYVKQHKLRLLLLALVSLLGVSFEVAKPLPIKLVIDNVLSDRPLPSFLQSLFHNNAFLQNKQQLLIACIVFMGCIAICSAVFSLFIFKLTLQLAQRLVYDLMSDFYSKLQRLSLAFYTKNKVGDLLQRITGDVFVVYFLVAQILLPAVTSLLGLGIMFYIMAQLDVVLAMVAFSVVPLLGIVLAFFAKPMNETTAAQYAKQGRLFSFVQQSLSSMKIIQAFGQESAMHEKLKAHAREFNQAFVVANSVSMRYNQLSALITGLASAALLGLGAYRAMHSALSAGDLFIFLGYITALYGPVNSLTTAIGTAIALEARGKRVFDILDSDDVVPEKAHALRPPSLRGAVAFKNVSFGYGAPGSSPDAVLQNICFNVEPGQVVAIVGATGTGKTSLISLLTRFYDPWNGAITIDGIDLRDMQLQALRAQISLVLQEPFLFPMSIADNIAFGNGDASFDGIVEAAKGAQAHAFISGLPDGYQTVLSEGGTTLSGGEKQRIAIARAFLKKAPILILDEPTSAVDAATEANIFEALQRFGKGKTVFLISHRLSAIKHADQIITIKDGHVAEQGTHQSLLQQNKVYAGLYKYQHIT